MNTRNEMRLIHIITGAVLALAIAGHGVGQTAKKTEPLKCGKYQHAYREYSCGPAQCDGCFTVCVPPPDKCVDDMHQVTEREWQEILHTLKDNTESIRMLNQMIRTLSGMQH